MISPDRANLVLGGGGWVGGDLFPLVSVVAVISVVIETAHIAAGLVVVVGGGSGGFTNKIAVLGLPDASLMSEINIIFS